KAALTLGRVKPVFSPRAVSLRIRPVLPPFFFFPAPQFRPQAPRTPPRLRCSSAPAPLRACAAPPPSPFPPPLRLPNSARTASAVATKTKIRRLAAALPLSTSTRATASRLPETLCTFPKRLFRIRAPCPLSSSNLFPPAPAASQSARGPKESAPDPDSSHRAAGQCFLPSAARSDRQTRESREGCSPLPAAMPAIPACVPFACRPNPHTAPSRT